MYLCVWGGVGRVMDEYGQRDLFSGVANNRGSESERAGEEDEKGYNIGGRWWLDDALATKSTLLLRHPVRPYARCSAAESQGNRMCLGLFASRLKPKN